MKYVFHLFVLLGLSVVVHSYSQPVFEVKSPNNKIQLNINVEEDISFEIFFDSVKIVENTSVSMQVNDHYLGRKPWIKKKVTKSVNEIVKPVVAEKNKIIPNHYNEILLEFKGRYSIVFRVYDNGIAWRFMTSFSKDIVVHKESVDFKFPDRSAIYFPEEESFFSHNERLYKHESLDEITSDQFCSLPALIDLESGTKVLLTETALEDYPGMWLKGTNCNGLQAIFPGYALKEEQTNDRNVRVANYADYLAKSKGTRSFPWRIVAIAENDADLIINQLSYLLADPCVLEGAEWIKPGKVAWDWWNDWNISGVDFESGVNTETYKYYIDFAAEYGIEYIIMDEGWYELGDLLKVVPEIDMVEIMAYASSKNVGVILWVIWKTLDDQWTEAFNQFEEWGVKGIKVDFMQRDDQWMVNYYHRVAAESAKRKMLVDFHGAYKPSGLRRKYPNVITSEGVVGLENVKWSKKNTPGHNVTLPFIRMVAGPMDYTPGAMINTTEKNFSISWSRPMSMGTRCHQLAMYVVYESPLQMLCDNPTNYYKEPDCMDFLARVPTTWDTTVVLRASIGEEIVLARQKDEVWYIGAMTNWESRDITIDLSFLDEGKYMIHYFKDGANAHRYASDFKKEQKLILPSDTLNIHLAPGGGWIGQIVKK